MHEKREFPRRAVTLPCYVEADDISFHTMTIDISLGGVRLVRPSLAHAFLRTPIRAVRIDTLPRLEVVPVWQKMGEIGSKFRNPITARPHIVELFERLDREGRVTPLSIEQALEA